MVLAAGAAGCAERGSTGSPTAPAPARAVGEPWAAATRTVADHLSTSWGRRVLVDGVVDAGEYERASRAVVECAAEHDVDLRVERRHGLIFYSSTGFDDVVVLDRCEKADAGAIRQLYEHVYADPREEGVEVYYRCLTDAGLLERSASRGDSLAGLLQELEVRVAGSAARSALLQRCVYDPSGRTNPSES